MGVKTLNLCYHLFNVGVPILVVCLFRSSSAVEQSAVNRWVISSNLICGANLTDSRYSVTSSVIGRDAITVW